MKYFKRMEVEKRRSKGGFLNLFDWNGRSRKKLFSNNSELPEELKRGDENAENVSKSWFNRVEIDDNEASSSNKGSGDYNCASSVTDDEGGAARAPGVVARLMGLDMLPASIVAEPCPTPSLDSCSYRPSFYDRSNPNLWSDYHLMDFVNVPNKLEKSSWNTIESTTQKHQNRPFERFQSETLPPKSAKSIPIMHHRLLSPIKSPGFIPTKNVSYIMEAAAKIIDASPQESTKNKASSLRSSSVPLRIRDLKQKLEAGHRASRPERFKRPSAVKYKSGHSNDGSSNESEYKSFTNLKKSGSDNVKNKGKSVSLTVQAKVNVEKRNGSTSSSKRTFMNQKEKNYVKSNQFSKNLPSMQRSEQKRTFANRTSNVLQQNNQKQNSLSNNDNSSSKTSVSNQLTRTRSSDGSVGPNKTLNKVVVNSETGAKRLSSVAIPTEKEFPLSTRMKVPLKKMPVSGEVRLRKNIIDVALLNNDESSRKCNVAVNGCTSSGGDSMKQGMDVISFTFTSPLRKSRPETNSSSHVMGINNHIGNDSFANSDQPLLSNFQLSSPGLNAIGGDALSVLLEQKLQELRHKVDSSHCNLIREGTSASLVSGFQDSDPSVMSSKSREENKSLQFGLLRHKLDSLYDLDSSSLDDLVQNVNRQRQGSEWMEVRSSCSNNSATGEELDCLNPRPSSSFEHSFASGSVPDNSQSTIESTKYLMEQAQESSNWHSTNESLQVGGEIELSDSASSMSTMDMSRKHVSRTFSLMGSMGSSNWELDYVRDILNSAELMLEDFALGQTGRVVAPNLFDQLENLGNGSQRNGEEYYKLGRKVLYDCVNECLDLRYGPILAGISSKSLANSVALSGRKMWIAEELYKEILGWKSMEDLMVDELVDKDMSIQNGRWLDFDMEVCEEGMEIEKQILASLVDEFVSDISH
ncbi:uncharacterized protein LOC122316594 isoform X1 [Carya illinoinensis]|uniref:DUF4378 domain-containing protein n=2 Tax=Carya illinoinensis TaxID=32201 RepID=A0A8T1PU83_CARIL|nr:uncharacterized protein LOC122316594 isoform X1 [Carya illinoinensis]KAG6646725.1 hypothetical protein CIPAW_07G027700 [Carya illinoinensis]